MAARKDPYEGLKTMIVRGRIAPGLRLTENDIAARMAVSRTPAREALRRLRADGLLVVRDAGRRVPRWCGACRRPGEPTGLASVL